MISSIQDFKSKIEAIEWPNFWPFNSPAHVQSSDTKYELLGDLDLIELESLEPTPRAAARSSASNVRAAGWIIVNIVSTVLIVFTNKSIFSHESLRKCQMAFTSFHFLITSITLWIMSRPCLGGFVAKSIPPHRILHLAGLMCAQIVLQNISLAYSSVIFHQLVRLLLTPITALSNFLLYQATIPKASIMPLVIMCSGVGIVFYYDTVTTAAGGETTSPTGAFAAIVGVCSSALYTTLVGRYHKKFDVTSMQLLLNQSSLGTGLLLCSVPFFDTLPSMNALSGRLYTSLLLSGLCAFLVNLSQFYVIEASGPVSSTVVGHFKTCMIIGLGWMVSGHSTMSQSIAGVFMALVGMSWYMLTILQSRG